MRAFAVIASLLLAGCASMTGAPATDNFKKIRVYLHVLGRNPDEDSPVLGWEVSDIHAAIRALTANGVKFEQFNLPFMKQDEHGVWTPPNGDQVAWFKDPDGNTLSISRHVKGPVPS